VKVYIDNSVIGRLADIDRGIRRTSSKLNEDTVVLPQLFSRCAKKGIQLCTSDETIREIEQVRSDMPRLADTLIAKCKELTVLTVRHHERHFNRKYLVSSIYDKDVLDQIEFLVEELTQFLLDKTRVMRKSKRQAVEADAYHLAVSKYYNCRIFVTCDYVSIWAYRRLLKRHFDIDVRRPVELCEALHRRVTGGNSTIAGEFDTLIP
jgi:predicted nucleic acid-binding protein